MAPKARARSFRTPIVLHDADGVCEGSGIVSASEEIRKACKPGRRGVDRVLVATADKLAVCDDGPTGTELAHLAAGDYGRFHSVQFTGALIDGSFPPWRNVIPQRFAPLGSVTIGVKHVVALGKALSRNSSQATLQFFGSGDPGEPMIVRGGDLVSAFAVLMPTRDVREAPPALWFEVTTTKPAAVAA